MKQGSSLYII
jgi:dihydrolipoamide dehydrogenase